MPLTLLYFAWVREKIGREQETVELPPGIADVAGVIGWLAAGGGGHAEAFADLSRLRYALDEEFVNADAPVEGAKELAVFPPVTGG